MTDDYYVSLNNTNKQPIPPNRYTLLRFPENQENDDDWLMHGGMEGDESGLIHPFIDGLATVEANIHWEPGDYTKICDRFDRNPLTSAIDPTAYDHRNPCIGMQCITKNHNFKVRKGVPLGIRVKHNAPDWTNVTFAQFKLWIRG